MSDIAPAVREVILCQEQDRAERVESPGRKHLRISSSQIQQDYVAWRRTVGYQMSHPSEIAL
jgi:hypothetical protein